MSNRLAEIKARNRARRSNMSTAEFLNGGTDDLRDINYLLSLLDRPVSQDAQEVVQRIAKEIQQRFLPDHRTATGVSDTREQIAVIIAPHLVTALQSHADAARPKVSQDAQEIKRRIADFIFNFCGHDERDRSYDWCPSCVARFVVEAIDAARPKVSEDDEKVALEIVWQAKRDASSTSCDCEDLWCNHWEDIVADRIASDRASVRLAERESERIRVIAYLSHDTVYSDNFCLRCSHCRSNCECAAPVYIENVQSDEKLKALKLALFVEDRN